MSFTNFTTKSGHSFGGEYLEIVPNERIRYTDQFDDPNLPGVMEVTVNLKAVSAAPKSTSNRQTCRRSFRSKPAISAGNSRSPSSRWSLGASRIFTGIDPSDASARAARWLHG